MADEKDLNVPKDPNAAAAAQESPESPASGQAVGTAAKAPPPEQPSVEAGVETPAVEASAESPSEAPVDEAAPATKEADVSEEEAEAAMLKMLEDLPDEENQPSADDININNAQVSRAEFQQLSEPASKGEIRNMDLLLDVNLPVAIELGRTRMSISDILALGPGSVVELNKLAGEPVDLLVNQKIVARGEVVVIDENFGVRITQLVTPQERLQSLAEDD